MVPESKLRSATPFVLSFNIEEPTDCSGRDKAIPPHHRTVSQHGKEHLLYVTGKMAFTDGKRVERQMLTRQCERCESVMREEQILLASERRYVVAYHCPSCGRNEYGTVVSSKELWKDSSATHQHFENMRSGLVK